VIVHPNKFTSCGSFPSNLDEMDRRIRRIIFMKKMQIIKMKDIL
jgi:hypothetical protein